MKEAVSRCLSKQLLLVSASTEEPSRRFQRSAIASPCGLIWKFPLLLMHKIQRVIGTLLSVCQLLSLKGHTDSWDETKPSNHEKAKKASFCTIKDAFFCKDVARNYQTGRVAKSRKLIIQKKQTVFYREMHDKLIVSV